MQPYGNVDLLPLCTIGMLVDDCAIYENTNAANIISGFNKNLRSIEKSAIGDYSTEGKIFTPTAGDYDDGGTFGMNDALRKTIGVVVSSNATDDFYFLSSNVTLTKNEKILLGYNRVGGSASGKPGAINTSSFIVGYSGTTFDSKNYLGSTNPIGIRTS